MLIQDEQAADCNDVSVGNVLGSMTASGAGR